MAKKKITQKLTGGWFTPEQPGVAEESRKSYKWRPMDGLQSMEVLAECKVINNDFIPSGTALRLAIGYGLVGWKNYVDEDGEALSFNRGLVGNIPANHLSHIAMEIINNSNISDEEAKN